MVHETKGYLNKEKTGSKIRKKGNIDNQHTGVDEVTSLLSFGINGRWCNQNVSIFSEER